MMTMVWQVLIRLDISQDCSLQTMILAKAIENRRHRDQIWVFSWVILYFYCKGCLSSNNPVPPLTTFPTTRQAEGETSWS